jgi:hypothetical protein
MNNIEKILFVRTETDNNKPGIVMIPEVKKKVDYILDIKNTEPLRVHENMIEAMHSWLIGRSLDPGFMSIINEMVTTKLNHQVEPRRHRRATVGGRKRKTRKYKK